MGDFFLEELKELYDLVSLNFDFNSILIVIVIIISTYWLKKIPDYRQEINHDNSYESSILKIQADKYYRNIDGQEMRDNVAWWMDFISDSEKKNKEISKNVSILTEKFNYIMRYGSSRTIKLLSVYMQHIYTASSNTKTDDSYKQLVYLAYVAASIKADYTGNTCSPLDLLALKFNDFNDNKRVYKKVTREIRRKTGIDKNLRYSRLK